MLDPWIGVLIGAMALMIVVLIAAMLVGQPAALSYTNERVNAQATQIVRLNSQLPAPTPYLTAVPRIR